MNNLFYGLAGIKLTFLRSVLILLIPVSIQGQSIADTFDTGDIPTSLSTFSTSCNGPLTIINIMLPSGGSKTVTGIDIQYNMTAQSGGFKSHQRSYIKSQNTLLAETTIYEGTGNTAGTQPYARTNVNIANGTYPGGTVLRFEMRAWRTTVGSGCGVGFNKVDNNSWIIKVYYTNVADEGSVGIGTSSPATSAILDLTSTNQGFVLPRMSTMQRDAIANPIGGMMIFNTTTMTVDVYTDRWGKIYNEEIKFKKLFGGSLSETPNVIRKTPDGNYIVAGASNSTNSGTMTGLSNFGSMDFFFMKISKYGNIIWQKLYGGTGFEQLDYMSVTADGGCIAIGSSTSSNSGTLSTLTNHGSSDFWILKLNADGNIQWQKLYGGSAADEGKSIEQTTNGGYIVSGLTSSSNTGNLTGMTNNGMQDEWILRLDSGGNIVWQRLFGGTDNDVCRRISLATSGGYICSGYTSSSNTGTLTGIISNGSQDGHIMKLDSSGNITWQRLMGGSSNDQMEDIRPTTDGYISVGFTSSTNSGTLTGFTNNGIVDGWIQSFDLSGNLNWQKLFGGIGAEQLYGLSIRANNYFAYGYSNSDNTGTLAGYGTYGPSDAYVIKLDLNGNVEYQKLCGGNSGDGIYYGEAIDGGLIIAASSSSSNTGMLSGLGNNGLSDIWIFTLDDNGNP